MITFTRHAAKRLFERRAILVDDTETRQAIAAALEADALNWPPEAKEAHILLVVNGQRCDFVLKRGASGWVVVTCMTGRRKRHRNGNKKKAKDIARTTGFNFTRLKRDAAQKRARLDGK